MLRALARTAATPFAGAFAGATSQRERISVTVSPTHRSIGRKNTKLALTCPDGYASTFTISKPIPVVIRRGAFNSSWRGTSSLGAPYRIRFAGRFASAKRPSGTIQITITYPKHGACGSGSVSWSARHR